MNNIQVEQSLAIYAYKAAKDRATDLGVSDSRIDDILSQLYDLGAESFEPRLSQDEAESYRMEPIYDDFTQKPTYEDRLSRKMVDSLPPFFQQPRYETTLITGVLEKDCAEMWASGKAAQDMLANGYDLPKKIEELDNTLHITTFRTKLSTRGMEK